MFDPYAPEPGAPAGHEIPYKAEVARKVLHLVSLVVPLFMALAGRSLALTVLIPLALAALAADVLRVRVAGFARFIEHWFGFMMRGEERPPVGGDVVINGATWVLLTAALLTMLFPIHLAVPAFVMFMVADAAAALFGRRFGRHPWGQGPRTVEGSAAFFVVGVAIMALFSTVVFWMGVVSVAVACAAEAMPGPLNDNVRVPLVAAFVLFLLERFA